MESVRLPLLVRHRRPARRLPPRPGIDLPARPAALRALVRAGRAGDRRRGGPVRLPLAARPLAGGAAPALRPGAGLELGALDQPLRQPLRRRLPGRRRRGLGAALVAAGRDPPPCRGQRTDRDRGAAAGHRRQPDAGRMGRGPLRHRARWPDPDRPRLPALHPRSDPRCPGRLDRCRHGPGPGLARLRRRRRTVHPRRRSSPSAPSRDGFDLCRAAAAGGDRARRPARRRPRRARIRPARSSTPPP